MEREFKYEVQKCSSSSSYKWSQSVALIPIYIHSFLFQYFVWIVTGAFSFLMSVYSVGTVHFILTRCLYRVEATLLTVDPALQAWRFHIHTVGDGCYIWAPYSTWDQTQGLDYTSHELHPLEISPDPLGSVSICSLMQKLCQSFASICV